MNSKSQNERKETSISHEIFLIYIQNLFRSIGQYFNFFLKQKIMNSDYLVMTFSVDTTLNCKDILLQIELKI